MRTHAPNHGDPWVGGQKQLHFWNPRPRFAYSLCYFYWAPTTIKGRLLSSCWMLKPFSDEKNSKSRRNGAQKLRFWGKMGVQTLDIGFATPKRHFLASFDVFCIKVSARVSAVAFLKNQKNSSRVTLCLGARNHACAEPKPLNRFG